MTDRSKPVPSVHSGSDEVAASSEPAFLAIGRVLRPHGVRGELRVEIHTDYPERFAVYKTVYLGPKYVPYAIESHRFHQGKVLVKLADINDRTAAEALREQWMSISTADAIPLGDGEIYVHQMLQLRVVTVEGEDLGEIQEVIETGANLVYVVQGPSGQILLPDIPEVFLQIDLTTGVATVRLLEGLR
jgi:16S rRNA processing protein RimM